MKSGFEIVAYPTVYNARRISSIPEAANAVRDNEVSLRGWNFPHTHNTAAPFANGFQSATVSKIFGVHIEGYRIYQSGLFVWHGVFREDTQEKKGQDGQPLLELVSTIWSFTEFLLFLTRLYERIAPDATIRIEIVLRGCKGRELAPLDPSIAWFGGYISQEDVIRVEREAHVSELRGAHVSIAAAMMKQVFHVFGWLGVTDKAIEQWQQKLLKREF